MENMLCAVHNCRDTADFESPGDWCYFHWHIWFTWPKEKDGKEPPWFPRLDKNHDEK